MQSDGYATELEYVDDFNSALNPLWIDFSLNLAGIATRKNSLDSTNLQQFRYLELGFGMGNSFTLHASCSKGEFIGNDLMPAHCQHARRFLAASKSCAKVYEESFKQIKEHLVEENLKFDYIVLHGVWSWISKENQQIILEIISHHLISGGVLYISYNCFPGWEGKYSLRHLLKAYESRANGNQENRIQQTIHWAQNLFDSNPLYIMQNPRTQEINQELRTREINYLCHEFFNQDWHCLFFTQMANTLQNLQCKFACSAKLMWHFDPLTFSVQEKYLLEETKDSLLQEQLKDFFLNESFRMDLFVRNGEKLTKQERENRLLRTSFVLLKPPLGFQSANESPLEFQAFCQQILEFFAQDSYAPKTLRVLVESFSVDTSVLLPIICAMMTQGFLHPTQPINPKILAQAKAHNAILFSQKQGVRKFLAAPLIGGGIYIEEITWTCLKGYVHGILERESLKKFVSTTIPNLPEELLNHCIEQFFNTLTLYRTLGIVD